MELADNDNDDDDCDGDCSWQARIFMQSKRQIVKAVASLP